MLRPAAGGAGHQAPGRLFPQADGLQNVAGRRTISSAGSAVRVTRRVSPMPWASRPPMPMADFMRPHVGGARLGDAEVERVVAPLVHHAGRPRMAMDTLEDFSETQMSSKSYLFQQSDMPKGGLHQCLRASDRRTSPAEAFPETAAVDADADGNAALGAGVGHSLAPGPPRRCCRG